MEAERVLLRANRQCRSIIPRCSRRRDGAAVGNEFVERGILDFLQGRDAILSAGDGFPRIPMRSPCP